MLQPIALPAVEITALVTKGGTYVPHPAGLIEGRRPEWDQARARLAALAERPTAIVSKPPAQRRDLLRGLQRLVRRVLDRLS